MVVRFGVADARSKDEAESAGARFFVGVHDGDELAGGNVGPRWKWAHAANERDDARDFVGRSAMQFVAEQRGGHHAPGDSFAVLVDAIARDRFESVSEGVAEIQDFAKAGFAFVFRDHLGFDFEGVRNDVGKRMGFSAEHRGEIFFEVGEKRGVGDDAVLDDFGEAAAILALGERFQSGRIDEHEARGIERADKIFAFRKIDSGLAADGGIDLRDERGGNLHERNATQAGGSDEAGDVTDDASADGDYERVAIDAGADERAMEFFGGGESLGGFSIVHEMHARSAVAAECSEDGLPYPAPNLGRRNHVDVREVAEAAEFLVSGAKNPEAAENGVFAGARLDRDALRFHSSEF